MISIISCNLFLKKKPFHIITQKEERCTVYTFNEAGFHFSRLVTAEGGTWKAIWAKQLGKDPQPKFGLRYGLIDEHDGIQILLLGFDIHLP